MRRHDEEGRHEKRRADEEVGSPAAASTDRHSAVCYSAQIEAQYRSYVRLFGASLSIKEFYNLFWRRAKEACTINIPRGVEDSFSDPGNEQEREIKALIDEYRARQAGEYETLVFEQKQRLTTAQRKLFAKVTKGAQEEVRKATNKIGWAREKLADLNRVEPREIDSRIFPDWYVPVLVVQNGERVVMPMRYHCLPAGKPKENDGRFPGTFNARRDSLGRYWKGTFGVNHGLILASAFFEYVPRHKAEGRALNAGEKPESVILEFTPNTGGQMLVACLWSRWTSPGEPDLLSFAAVTDEPPPEVAAAGHDRCIIPIKPENVEAWLNPDPSDLAAQYGILDDRERPHYEHRLAA